MLMNQAALLRAEQAMWRISYIEKKIWNFLFCQGPGQVQAQTGFQAQPGLHQVQVHVFRRY